MDEVEEKVQAEGDFDDFDLPPSPDVTDDDSDPEEAGTDDEAAEDVDEDKSHPPTPGFEGKTRGIRVSSDGGPALSEDVRVLPPEECMTSDFLSQYEVARVLSVRAEQIARTNDVLLPEGTPRPSFDPVMLAKQELLAGMCPLIVQRRRGSSRGQEVIEEHRVRDLLLLTAI